jgi:hypothetical protein
VYVNVCVKCDMRAPRVYQGPSSTGVLKACTRMSRQTTRWVGSGARGWVVCVEGGGVLGAGACIVVTHHAGHPWFPQQVISGPVECVPQRMHSVCLKGVMQSVG